jgi:methyl-accepting chemotaxis protein
MSRLEADHLPPRSLRGNLEGMHTVPKDQKRGGALSFFRNMQTARKLLVGFLAVTVLMIGVGVVGISKMGNAQTTLKGMYVDNLQAINWLGDVDADFQMTRYTVLNLALVTSPAARTQTKAKIAELDGLVDANWKKYTATDMRGREKPRDQFSADLAQYRTLREQKLIPLLDAGRMKEFLALRDTTVSPLTASMMAALNDLNTIETKAASTALSDAKAAYESARLLIIGIILAALLLSIGLAVGIGRMIARPLRQTVEVLEGLAEGRLDQHLDVDSKDEVGQMAVALNTAMAKLRETMSAMGNNAQGLASSSEELSSVSSQMTGSAEESATQANLVSAAAEQVSRNVQTVATGTEEMSASIREIAKNAHDAAGVAEQAVHVAETTSATVAKLGQSSAEIGTVIKVINSIAEQTNLLALNATIEAARAGEAGKGFAVVANEVKELAQETSKATEDIGRRIEAIQSDTAAAVAAITEISGIIAQINDTQSTIASAVEEQTATTNEMGRNVTEAATGSSDIAENITGVARSASDTTAAASSTSQAADELARMASDLQQLVGQFAY